MAKSKLGLILINAKSFSFEKIEKIVNIAKNTNSKVIVFPENYPKNLTDEDFSKLKDISSRKNLFFLVTKKGERHSSYLITPKESIRIDKISNFGLDKKKYIPGTEINIFSVNGINFSVLVCYDFYFSEYITKLKGKNLDFLIVLSSVPPKRGGFWRSLVMIRSSELQIPIVSSASGELMDEPLDFIAFPSFKIKSRSNKKDYFLVKLGKIKVLRESPFIRGKILLKDGLFGPYVGDVRNCVKIKKRKV